MNMFAFSGFLWAATTLALGIFVLAVGKTKVQKLWGVFNLTVTIWAFGYGMAAISKDMRMAAFWWCFAHIGANANPVIILHAVCALGGIKRKALLMFGYFQAVFFLILAFMGKIDLSMQYLFNSFYYPKISIYYIKQLGINFPIFMYIWLFYLVYALYLLYTIYGKSAGISKKQAGWFLIGEITGFSGASLYFLPLFGIKWYPYWNFTVPLYCVIATYAIFRHKMLDIEVIIKRTLVFAGLLASTFAMVILPTLVIQEYVFRRAGVGSRAIGLLISATIIMLSLRRIEDFLRRITDNYLFQKRYNYKELLKTFTSEVLTVLDLSRLLSTTIDKLTSIIKLQSCGILLQAKGKSEYELIASQGIKDKTLVLGSDNTLTTFLLRTRSYLSVSHHGKEYSMPEKIIRDMNKLNLELAIPLVNLQGEMTGILTLGKKKSDEEYTQDDMDILLPLARTLAIAISNAQMFDELGKTQAEAAQREKMAVIGTLSAGINHEICNPLGIARGQCEAFLLNMKDGLYKSKTSEELVEKARTIMEKVIHETDRATTITKRLSSFAKPSKGIMSDDVSIKDGIDEVLALLGYEMTLDKIDMVKEIPDDLPFISADKKALEEVFFNLIRNAAQALKEDKGKITIRARKVGEKVTIEIEDTGHGIPADKLNDIFNPFYTTKEPGKGTGLGLFIVKQVVEKNKGKISVKSEFGVGTTFTLDFPAVMKVRV